MRKIAIVTGTRAEYGPLRPLMTAVQNDADLKLIPIVTGMHLLPKYGNTYHLVEKDFSHIVKIPMPLKGDTLQDMAFYLSVGVKNFAAYLSKNHPDIIIITGDRSEQLAAALAAFYLNIPIVHINGGDVSGGMIDESIRHAITKIAHIHLAHTKKNAERIKKMGEDTWRIHITGTLAIEAIQEIKMKSKKELFATYHLDPNSITFLVVQHPITTLQDKGFEQFHQVMNALDTLKEQTVLIYPNCDAGSRKFISLIKKYENRPYLHIFKNLPHDDYIGFMKYVDVMLGNSSSGIIEAPTLKTPVINIGSRQQGRDQSNNVITIIPKKEKIIATIYFELNNAVFKEKVKQCINKYGKGNASHKIVKILKTIKIDDRLIRKQISY